jgi:hypothetical protein
MTSVLVRQHISDVFVVPMISKSIALKLEYYLDQLNIVFDILQPPTTTLLASSHHDDLKKTDEKLCHQMSLKFAIVPKE